MRYKCQKLNLHATCKSPACRFKTCSYYFKPISFCLEENEKEPKTKELKELKLLIKGKSNVCSFTYACFSILTL